MENYLLKKIKSNVIVSQWRPISIRSVSPHIPSVREMWHSQWADIYYAFPKWRAQSTVPSSLMPQSVSRISFLIYLALPQQTLCCEVQFDISPSNLQWAVKWRESVLAWLPPTIQSLKLYKVPFICLCLLFIWVHLLCINEPNSVWVPVLP